MPRRLDLLEDIVRGFVFLLFVRGFGGGPLQPARTPFLFGLFDDFRLAELLDFRLVLGIDRGKLLAFVLQDIAQVLDLLWRHDRQNVDPVLPLLVVHALRMFDELQKIAKLLLQLCWNLEARSGWLLSGRWRWRWWRLRIRHAGMINDQ